jgi:hypothetical protein
MNKPKCFISASLASTLLLLGFSAEARRQTMPDAAAEIRIRQVITSLPPDSSLRRSLEQEYLNNGLQKRLNDLNGLTPNESLRASMQERLLAVGVHYPWMDDMKRFGVKIAMFEVHGTQQKTTGFRPLSVGHVIYRKAYDGPHSQITSENELQLIRAKGLEEELQRAAFEKAKRAISIVIDSPLRDDEPCSANIYLFDEEWLLDDELQTNLPQYGRYNPEKFPLYSAAAVGDELTATNLLASGRFAKEDLNAALFGAVAYPSDNTDVISLLLRAGADVNTERSNGTTPLMEAVPPLNLTNINLLVSSGADVHRETTNGSTAYSLALQVIKELEEKGNCTPTYMPEILKLLKPSPSDRR